jgi:hypothetical protein
LRACRKRDPEAFGQPLGRTIAGKSRTPLTRKFLFFG